MTRLKSTYPLILICLTLTIVACACPFSLPWNDSGRNGEGNNGEDANGTTLDWQAQVDAIRSMTRGMTIPDHLTEGDSTPNATDFDANQLLEPLDHLSLKEGYVLDYIYYYDGMGGSPILYARPEDHAPFKSLDEYKEAAENCSDQNPLCNYLLAIETDGTKEGFFQWVLLQMMGEQFYLFWHANYNDKQIIASQERLVEIINSIESDDPEYGLPDKARQEALKITTIPLITIAEDTVDVRVVWFTKWGGFFETVYTISTEAPHQILNMDVTNLVPYDCGIMF